MATRSSAAYSRPSTIVPAPARQLPPLQVNDTRAASLLASLPAEVAAAIAAGNNQATDMPSADTIDSRGSQRRRSRRTQEQVLRAFDSDIEEAAYAVQRLVALEARMARILSTVTPGALQHVTQHRPDWARFANN